MNLLLFYEDKKSKPLFFAKPKEDLFLKPERISPIKNEKQQEDYKGLDWEKIKKMSKVLF